MIPRTRNPGILTVRNPGVVIPGVRIPDAGEIVEGVSRVESAAEVKVCAPRIDKKRERWGLLVHAAGGGDVLS